MKAIKVLTSRSIETMLQEGGIGHWDIKDVDGCEYVICVKNKKAMTSSEVSHGCAFVIGKVSGLRPSFAGKSIIDISEYAEINIPAMWNGSTTKPIYLDTSEIQGLELDKLTWKEFRKTEKPVEVKRERPTGKIRHIVIWNIADSVQPQLKKVVSEKIKQELESLKNMIAGILELRVEINPLPASNGDVMLNSLFVNEEALENYQNHPEHKRAGAFVASVTKERRCVDYEE